MFKIAYTKQAADQLAQAPAKIQRLILAKIEALAADPFAKNNNVKALAGQDAYRLRVGDWRVVYAVQAKVLVLLVVRIACRDKVHE